MNVRLLNSFDSVAEMEFNAAYGALTCHANQHRDFTPSDVLKRIIKAGHESVLEHIALNFEVNSISRACLQELARHRHISLSVESTRHTLKQQLLTGEPVYVLPKGAHVSLETLISEYLQSLENFAKDNPDTPNDILKYAIPECVCSNLVLTCNIRELRHILKLRTSPAALQEFQDLARALFDAVPEEYRYLLEDCLCKEVINDGK